MIMGGKGGGGGDYYAQPPDTSGYATADQATATLNATKPVDLSSYQQAIDVQKAAADATAPTPTATPAAATNDTSASGSGSTLASSVLTPPGYWSNRQDLQPAPINKSSVKTTQT
jgi:hypothetical protein